MGDDLGEQYAALYGEFFLLRSNWAAYAELFGTRPERIDLLNQAAPVFFRMVQDTLLEVTLLHIARLTDPTKSGKEKENLTILNLPELISQPEIKEVVTNLTNIAVKKAEFCRDWRNRRIGHRDLDLYLDRSDPLADASRKKVNEALAAIEAVLNKVYLRCTGSEIGFCPRTSDVVTLLYILDDGLRAEDERSARFHRGEIRSEDCQPRDL
jgi:hypothetical protein